MPRGGICGLIEGLGYGARCPINTAAPPGADQIAACLPIAGYYGPSGIAPTLCPQVLSEMISWEDTMLLGGCMGGY